MNMQAVDSIHAEVSLVAKLKFHLCLPATILS